ncbi:MAG: amidohydrolase family protein [Gemmatimonadales bacterium]
MRRVRLPAAAVGVLLVLSPAAPLAARQGSPALWDHHVHILSPALVRDWKSLGVPFTRPDSVYTSAAALLAPSVTGGEGLAGVVLVPMAHFYGNAELRGALRLSPDEEAARVRQENDFVAREAARTPGRALAFCSVNHRRPYAWDELRRCRRELLSPGIKLHLASAGTDLRDEDQLAELARIAAWADAERIVLLLHFDPQARGLEVTDVERFIARVLDPYPDLRVTIAHLGGSGGYGPWTRDVFRTFIAWLENSPAPRPAVMFDLSAVILARESEGVPATTVEEAAALAPDLRRAGLGRILFGSDYPVFDPPAYAELLRERAGLSPEELRTILSNRRP